MIDATTPVGMARLFLLLETGSDCWRVISIELAQAMYRQATKTLANI